MQSAQKSLDHFIEQNGGKIPRSKPNLTSTGSDIAFQFTSNYLAVLDWWHATRDNRCVDMLVDGTDWVFTQTDRHIKDIEYDVTDWTNGKKTVQKRKLSDHGYSHSPRTEWSPGWCRWIYVEGQTLGNRPEVLTDGFTGQAIAHFINDCRDLIDQSKATEWLEKLAEIFVYHEPCFKYQYTHAGGKLFNTPHEGLKVSAYYWPAANDNSGRVHNNAVGFNQHSVFLTMGLLVEDMLGRDIGAKKQAEAFIADTLPHYLVNNGHDKVFHLYDLRDNPSEKSNDTFHAYKANIFLTIAIENGLLDNDVLQGQIIKQVHDVCHKGNGRMSVLMHGTDDHGGGYNPNNHPSAGHWQECLLWEKGDKLLPIAQMTLDLEHKGKTDHKSNSFHARFHRAVALHSGAIDPGPEPVPAPADLTNQKEPDNGSKKKSKEEKKNHSDSGCNASVGDSAQSISVDKETDIESTIDFKERGSYQFDDHGEIARVTNTWSHKFKKRCLCVTGIKPGATTLRYDKEGGGEGVVEIVVV